MRVAFPDEMAGIDRKIINEGLPSILLMEHAARSVAELIRRLGKGPVSVLCGTGNNGGDGYAVARLLKNSGIKTKVISTGDPKTDDAITNCELFGKLHGECISLKKVSTKRFGELFGKSAIIVDALFGTGFSGQLKNRLAGLIEIANSADCTRVAVDIPSGVDGKTGKVNGIAFKADYTVTFGVPKFGHFFFPGKAYTGQLIVEDWGFSHELIEGLTSMELLTDENARRLLPSRPSNSHKGTFGSVLVVGGSEDYTGAPLLTVRGALRVGSGLVYAIAPAEAMRQIRQTHPEAIVLSSRRTTGYLSPEDITSAEMIFDRIDCVVIGPGLGRHKLTGEFFRALVSKACSTGKSVIIDADGLYHYSTFRNELSRLPGIVLTPHPGEFSALTGVQVEGVRANIILLREFAAENQLGVLLKDSTSVFVSDAGKTWISCHGNSALAKGGSGDLLAGAIGGFAAQTKELSRSVLLGTYFLGKAAEFSKQSEAFVLPGEIAGAFDEVFKYLRSDDSRGGDTS